MEITPQSHNPLQANGSPQLIHKLSTGLHTVSRGSFVDFTCEPPCHNDTIKQWHNVCHTWGLLPHATGNTPGYSTLKGLSQMTQNQPQGQRAALTSTLRALAIAGEGGASIPLGLSIDPDVLRRAHEAAVEMTQGHPEIEKQVEKLAQEGIQALKNGDIATGLRTKVQAMQLIAEADGSKSKQGAEKAVRDQADLGALILSSLVATPKAA